MKVTITIEDSVFEIKDGVFHGQPEWLAKDLTARAKGIEFSPSYPSLDYQIAFDTARYLGLTDRNVNISGENGVEIDDEGNPLIH